MFNNLLKKLRQIVVSEGKPSKPGGTDTARGNWFEPFSVFDVLRVDIYYYASGTRTIDVVVTSIRERGYYYRVDFVMKSGQDAERIKVLLVYKDRPQAGGVQKIDVIGHENPFERREQQVRINNHD